MQLSKLFAIEGVLMKHSHSGQKGRICGPATQGLHKAWKIHYEVTTGCDHGLIKFKISVYNYSTLVDSGKNYFMQGRSPIFKGAV
jgi:hypothetical protein